MKYEHYLVDTDILIDITKGKDGAVNFLGTFDNISISIISAMELMVGAGNTNEIKEIENFLFNYKREFLTERISLKAYELLKIHSKEDGLTIPDALIAATAVVSRLTLATRNVKHFEKIKELKVMEPSYS